MPSSIADADLAIVAVIPTATRTRPRRRQASSDRGRSLAGSTPGALVGGVPAENLDIENANAHDTKLIIPLVLRSCW